MKTVSLLLMAFLAGCISINKPLPSTAIPNPTKGYIAGRFVHSRSSVFEQSAMEIDCKNTGKICNIKLPKGKPQVMLFEAEPGTYQMTEVFMMAQDRIGKDVWQSIDPYNPRAQPFAVEPNSVSYIGDFDTKTTHAGPVYGISWSFGVRSMEDVIKEIQGIYPNFRQVRFIKCVETERNIK